MHDAQHAQPGEVPAAVVDARTRSKALLGNLDRLEVAVAVARSDDGVVNATDLANGASSLLVGWPNSRIRAQLVAFAQAGLMTVHPRDGAGRVWYVRQPSKFWDACVELYDHSGG